MNAKAMRWGSGHVDKYVYRDGEWQKVSCNLSAGMDCTAPRRLPRGTEFSYNARLTKHEEYSIDLYVGQAVQ